LFPSLPDGSRDVKPQWDYVETWKGMEKLPATGKAKAIGVANWSKKYLERLVENAKIIPAANQIENHPLLPQDEIVDYCKSQGIHVTAYSPLGSTGSPLFDIPAVVHVSKKNGVGPANVLISWHGEHMIAFTSLLTWPVARGSSVIPKSVKPSRIDENRKIIALDSADLEMLNGIMRAHGLKRYVFPPFKV
jgi:glycerol 2-dehydrogenase (NADP+)